MLIRRRICILASIVTCFFLQAQGADKYTDGNRPYEFGFSIDGEQHRHEKKDEKGLIEGEFGFITADGVYHVTVYATDEQGRFKILSMKNIRVKPYPTYTAKDTPTSARQGHSLELPAAAATSSPPVFTTSTFKPISIEPPARSCSHCSLPTTSTVPPIAANPFSNNPNQIGAVETSKFPQGIKTQTFTNQPTFENSPSLQQGSNYPEQPQNNFNGGQSPLSQDLLPPQYPQDFQPPTPAQNSVPGSYQQEEQGPGSNNPLQPLQGPGSSNPIQLSSVPSIPQQQPQAPAAISQSTYYENVPSGRTPKRLDNTPSFKPAAPKPNSLQRSSPDSRNDAGPAKPTLISAQMQIVDKNTDIYSRKPGENEGLPKGLTKDDMTTLLYTFNYTVGFHGHFEEGYTNGAKQGYYYVTGRNGVRTRVDYVADENGFRPKISQDVLDLLSDDVPKPETEKEEKYGLKGYEFKWLYYPVEAKGR